MTVAPYYNVYSAPTYENIGQECYFRKGWRLGRRLLIGRQSTPDFFTHQTTNTMQRLIIILIADLMAIASFYTPIQKQLTGPEVKKLRQIEHCVKILTNQNRHIHRHVRYQHHHNA